MKRKANHSHLNNKGLNPAPRKSNRLVKRGLISTGYKVENIQGDRACLFLSQQQEQLHNNDQWPRDDVNSSLPSSPDESLPSTSALNESVAKVYLNGCLDGVYSDLDSRGWTSATSTRIKTLLPSAGKSERLGIINNTDSSYWPFPNWPAASPLEINLIQPAQSTGKRSKIEWKDLPRWSDSKEDDPQESPSLLVQQKRKDCSTGLGQTEPLVMRTRSGREVKKVNREWKGTIDYKRTRSDPLPLIRRATTPPSTSHLDQKGRPDRPQSAMKHRSANKYSSGKEEELIIVTSTCQMPVAETSPDHSAFARAPKQKKATPPSSSLLILKARRRKAASGEDADPDAFSPIASGQQIRLAKYTLPAPRASLPKSDFYQRHKEEEGSPTPESRRREHSVQ